MPSSRGFFGPALLTVILAVTGANLAHADLTSCFSRPGEPNEQRFGDQVEPNGERLNSLIEPGTPRFGPQIEPHGQRIGVQVGSHGRGAS